MKTLKNSIAASTSMLTPHTYVLTSSSANAKTELNAFDLALHGVGISDFNYITVSSILPKGCREGTMADVATATPGSFMFCVMSKIVSSTPGERIASSIACITTKETVGCITEYHGACSKEEAEVRAIDMARRMVSQRNATIDTIKTISSDMVVETCGCSISLCLLLY
jgi:arginine decarboxylase